MTTKILVRRTGRTGPHGEVYESTSPDVPGVLREEIADAPGGGEAMVAGQGWKWWPVVPSQDLIRTQEITPWSMRDVGWRRYEGRGR